MVDPVSALSAVHAAAGAGRENRRQRRRGASNVIHISTAKPRTFGYKVTVLIENGSSTGISSVAVKLKMDAGELVLDGEVCRTATVFAGHAIGSSRNLTIEFPHLVRFDTDTFDAVSGSGIGFTTTLFWCDALGKRWRRVGGTGAKICRPRDFPEPST